MDNHAVASFSSRLIAPHIADRRNHLRAIEYTGCATRPFHHPPGAIEDVCEMFKENGLDIVTLLRDSTGYRELGGRADVTRGVAPVRRAKCSLSYNLQEAPSERDTLETRFSELRSQSPLRPSSLTEASE
jgi:hypothetical protein